MKTTVDYTDETREAIIKEQEAKENVLIEDQRHFDGNHLIFEVPDRDLVAEVDDLKARIEKLEKNTLVAEG